MILRTANQMPVRTRVLGPRTQTLHV